MADNSNGTNSSVIKAPEYKELASVTEGRTITGDSTRAESIRSFGYQEETGSGAGDWFGNLLTTDYFWNNNREPAPSFNFFLRIEAVFDAPCRSVRAFTKENEFEEIQEGGRNDYVILKRKPISRRFTLQVERYVGIDKVDPLQLGTEMVLPMILAVSRVSSSSSGFAETLSETEFIRFYAFTGCIVTGKEYGELNAEQSGLLREVTTIAYREMIALTTPNADMTKKPWNIVDWDANRTDPNARANDPFPAWNEARAEKRTWLIGSHQENKDKTENDMRSAARPKSDSNRAKAKMWGGFDGSSHDKTKNKSATQNEYDGTTATVKSWKMPAEGEEASAKALRSATVNDSNDKARAVKKAWKVKKGKIDAKGRSATVPESDTRKATVKSWNMDPKKTRQSKAVKPTDDKKRAKAVSFTIKNPEKNAFAVKPPADDKKAVVSNMFGGSKKATVNSQNDSARATLKAWKIKKGGIDVASRIAAVPENDGSKATVKSWNMDPKLSRQQSAGKPTGDEKRAGAKAFDINSPGENKFAEKPTGDSERASASNMFDGGKNAAAPGNDKNRARVNSWNINPAMEQSSKAEKPGNDTQKAAVKTFDINSPAKNISAERPVNDKERAEAVNMLDGGKSATVNDKNDSTRAAIKAWKAKKGGDKGSRSAVIPTADDARAKVSSWNMDSRKGRQSSAVKPATDTKKAAKKAFNIKNPGQNTFAVKPTGDKNRAEVINFLNGGKRAR